MSGMVKCRPPEFKLGTDLRHILGRSLSELVSDFMHVSLLYSRQKSLVNVFSVGTEWELHVHLSAR